MTNEQSKGLSKSCERPRATQPETRQCGRDISGPWTADGPRSSGEQPGAGWDPGPRGSAPGEAAPPARHRVSAGSWAQPRLGRPLVPAAGQRGARGPNALQELCSGGRLQAARGGLLTGERASSRRSGPGREGRGAAKASSTKREAPTVAPLPTEPSARGHRGLRQPQASPRSQTRPRPAGTGYASAWVVGGGRVATSLCSCALL